MKTRQTLTVIFLLSIIFSIGNISCHSGKTAVSCPEISIKKSEYRANHKIRNSKKLIANRSWSKNHNMTRSKAKKDVRTISIPGTVASESTQISKIEFTKNLIASTDNKFNPIISAAPKPVLLNEKILDKNKQNKSNIQEVKCDTIYLKSGSVIIGKVEEIGQSELRYKRCDNLTGPVILLLKSDVARINYSNGTNDFFGPTEMQIPNRNNVPNQSISYNNSAPLKTEGLGLAGFISGLVGLFIASIPLGIIAVVFGGISLSKIKKNPGMYKGRGFAIASIILGIVDVVGMIILLGSV